MLDPLTAVGLAGNVIQVISFSAELVSEGRKIYKDVDGVLLENREAEEVASDLKAITDSLSASLEDWLHNHQGQSLDPDDTKLRNVCERCSEVAYDLVVHLQKLKVPSDAKRRKWKSFKQALLSVWDQGKIDDITKRLDMYHREIDTHILVSLRASLQSVDARQDQRFFELSKETQKLANAIIDQRDLFSIELGDSNNLLNQIITGQDRTHQMLSGLNRLMTVRSESPFDSTNSSQQSTIIADGNLRTTPLHGAAAKGDEMTVRKLLRIGSRDLNAMDEYGASPLHIAVSADVAKRLIDKGADLHAEDLDGATPLHYACLTRRLPVIKTLLEARASTKIEDDFGNSPSFYASECPTAMWLLRYGPDVEARAEDHLKNTGLLQLAWLGDREGVEYFLSQNANVNATNDFKETALTEASRHQDLEVMKLLLAHSADLEVQCDNAGWTPLLQAIRDGRCEAAKLLLQHGADKDARLKAGNDALAEAFWRKHWDIARLLIEEYSADVNTKDCLSATALMHAAEKDTTEVMQWLIAAGADINAQNFEGSTALFRAVQFDKIAACRILLDAGANISCKGKDGLTPLCKASEKGLTQIGELLLKYGADPSFSGLVSPLAQACMHGHGDVARLLLRYAAAPNVRDAQGYSPLCEACRGSDSKDDIVRMLLTHPVNLEVRNLGGWSALAEAAYHARDGAIKLLAEKGANLESKGEEGFGSHTQGWTPLMRASRQGHHATVACLADLGADLDAQDDRGFSALSIAVQKSDHQTVLTLIRKGANPDISNNYGVTPLMEAAARGMEVIVRILIDAHANLRQRDHRFVTAWDVARHAARDTKLKHLLEPSHAEDEKLRELQRSHHPREIAAYFNDVRRKVEPARNKLASRPKGLTPIQPFQNLQESQ